MIVLLFGDDLVVVVDYVCDVGYVTAVGVIYDGVAAICAVGVAGNVDGIGVSIRYVSVVGVVGAVCVDT